MGEDFFALAARQRAHRSFVPEPVDDATVEQLLEAAVHAPSAENSQPWEFVVVRDDATRAALTGLMVRAFDGGVREWSQGRVPPAIVADFERGLGGGFDGAPVLVVVCADTTRCLEVTVPSSIYPAVQNLLLAATALGLGSALTTLALVYAREVRELLGLPEHVQPVALVPIGHPARPLGPPRRDPARRHAHRDRYGVPW